MTRYKDYYLTNPKNIKLFVREWMPDRDPVAVILYVHGLGSHCGRMDHWAERFVMKDVGFMGFDQQGHGRSEGKRGYPKNLSVLLNDLGYMVQRIKESYPGIPLLLYGHSMGGNVVLNYAITSPGMADGLIVSSPWISLVNPPSRLLQLLVKPLTLIVPGMTLSNGLNPEDISAVPEEVNKYREDPLVHDRISIGLFEGVRKGGVRILQEAASINCPMLLMHGSADQITSHAASRELSEKSTGDTLFRLWEGARHEIHHEKLREEVFSFITTWLTDQRFL